MPNTSRGWPYPGLLDAPNGATALQQLAVKGDSVEGEHDALVTSLALLRNPPRCRAYLGAALNLPNDSWLRISMSGESYDWSETPMHDTSSGTYRVTIPAPGLYAIVATLSVEANNTGIRAVMVRKNADGVEDAGTYLGGNTIDTPFSTYAGNVQLMTEERLASGDRLEMYGRQISGATRALVTGSHGTSLSVRWVAP